MTVLEMIENLSLKEEEIKPTEIDYNKEYSTIELIIDNKESIEIITKETNFYAEKGGQVSDIGMMYVYGDFGVKRYSVLDVQWVGDVVVHYCKSDNEYKDGDNSKNEYNESMNDIDTKNVNNMKCKEEKRTNNKVKLVPDINRRDRIRCNHTATHIINSYIHRRGGKQSGSLVGHDKLRFDYTCKERIDINELEEYVNECISKSYDITIEHKDKKDIDESIVKQAEKYPDIVRIIGINDHKELCGGLHVKNTRDIKRCVIMSDGSISKGTRRIVTVTNEIAEDLFLKGNDLLNKEKESFKIYSELVKEKKYSEIEMVENVEGDLGMRVKGLINELRGMRVKDENKLRKGIIGEYVSISNVSNDKGVSNKNDKGASNEGDKGIDNANVTNTITDKNIVVIHAENLFGDIKSISKDMLAILTAILKKDKEKRIIIYKPMNDKVYYACSSSLKEWFDGKVIGDKIIGECGVDDFTVFVN